MTDDRSPHSPGTAGAAEQPLRIVDVINLASSAGRMTWVLFQGSEAMTAGVFVVSGSSA